MKELQVSMLSTLQNTYENKPLLKSNNVAEILDVSLGTVTNLVKGNKIPYIKFGDAKSSTIRFDIVAIAKWLEDKNSVKDIENE